MKKLALFVLLPVWLFALDLSLAKIYTDQNITGWLASEKLDGVRGYWDGKALYSRNKTPLNAPAWFIQNFPPYPLDGELWSKRNDFERIVSLCKSGGDESWRELKFYIFDAHIENTAFKDRLDLVAKWFGAHASPYAVLIKQTPVSSKAQVMQILQEMLSAGGEGLVLRNPNALYESGRSDSFLKLKPFFDDEARVLGYKKSQSDKYKGLTGSLRVQNTSGKIFHIGSGLSAQMRKNPPELGTVITYKYQGLTKNGIPRFPVFLRVKTDENWSGNVQ